MGGRLVMDWEGLQARFGRRGTGGPGNGERNGGQPKEA